MQLERSLEKVSICSDLLFTSRLLCCCEGGARYSYATACGRQGDCQVDAKIDRERGAVGEARSFDSEVIPPRRLASLASSLRHPNVIRMLDDFIVTEKEKMYIVLEFADGGRFARDAV